MNAFKCRNGQWALLGSCADDECRDRIPMGPRDCLRDPTVFIKLAEQMTVEFDSFEPTAMHSIHVQLQGCR